MKTHLNKTIKHIGLLSLCHMAVDFLCAFSLYHTFKESYNAFLIYNFCAFALQMPLGLLLDKWCLYTKKEILPGKIFVLAGIICTIVGSYISYIILGIGNALFHVGGGVITINEDNNTKLNGKGLGVFVAPGAIGLFLGSIFYSNNYYSVIQMIVAISLLFIGILLMIDKYELELIEKINENNSNLISIIVGCFLVVILRSLTSMAISFPWRKGFLISFLSVIFLAFGKTLGGFIQASIGMKKTTIITLSIAAIAYAFGNNIIFGLIALLFFNMTMPLTLYLLSKNMENTPGFAFGILTFGLFLGYLPILYGYLGNLNPIYGAITSLLSLAILYFAIMQSEKK